MVDIILSPLLLLAIASLCAWPLRYPLRSLVAPSDGRGPRFLRPLIALEGAILRWCGVVAPHDVSWRFYAAALLSVNLAGVVAVTLMLAGQGLLPGGPPGMPFHLAVNTAISFATNTNWQAYAGETQVHPVVQAAGLAVQNFLSAATGIAVLLVLMRALHRSERQGLGNPWYDLVRITTRVLLPLSVVFAVALATQGVVQTLDTTVDVRRPDGTTQTLTVGPVASQVAIRQLGTNGGGYYNTNGSHPFENPTPLTNLLEMVAILLLPIACVMVFGEAVGRRHGWALAATMAVVLAVAAVGMGLAESSPIQAIGTLPMEGKEQRFGVVGSTLWATATTAASNGSVNVMHGSMMPLSGGIQLALMMTGEVIFGGVGSGVYGMVLIVVLTVFLTGLMVGRSPEYLGRTIGIRDVGLAVVGVVGPSVLTLLFTAVALMLPGVRAAMGHHGPHGLTEVLYAMTSATANNGSAFAGLTASGPELTTLTSLAMLTGRYVVLLPALALAGSMAGRRVVPAGRGTFSTEGPMFVVLLLGVIVVVGLLTYLPVLLLGPVGEHVLMLEGVVR